MVVLDVNFDYNKSVKRIFFSFLEFAVITCCEIIDIFFFKQYISRLIIAILITCQQGTMFLAVFKPLFSHQHLFANMKMFTQVIFVLVVLLFAVQNSTCKELRFADAILFDFKLQQKLNTTISTKTKSTKVKNMLGCLSECIPVHWCKSVNLKTTPEKDGRHVCELLSTNKYTKVNNLTEDAAYQHLSLKVS